MKELYYEPHLERWRKQFGFDVPGHIVSPHNEAFLEERAKHDHALAVWDPLFQITARATLQAPAKLKSRDARIFLQYGVGRRVTDMFEAYRAIILTAHEGRKKPLRNEEQQAFSRDLNAFYINLRGILDNLAFCFLHERQPDQRQNLRDTDVGLFSVKFRKVVTAFSEIEPRISVHDQWNRDIKSRRDPAAHRIPLYLPPSLVTAQEAERAQQILLARDESIRSGRLEEASGLFDQAMGLGRFFPYFLHHPDDGPIPIYPTIPNDVAHLVEIANSVMDNLLSTQSSL